MGSGYQVKLDDSNNWKHTWKLLQYYNDNGDVIDYTVKEVTTSSYYDAEYMEENGIIIITNTLISAKPSDVVLEAEKQLEGRELKDKEFTFELFDRSGTVLQTKVNAQDGTITFDALHFNTEGTYTYKIKEVIGGDSSVSYDSHEVLVEIVVTFDKVNNKYDATISYKMDGESGNMFKNKVIPPITPSVIPPEKPSYFLKSYPSIKTGDTTNRMTYSVLLMLSGLFLAVGTFKLRKRK